MAKKFDPTLLVAIPLLGIIEGGYLSFSVVFMTNGREPWTSVGLLLGFGSSLWVFGCYLMPTSINAILGGWAVGSLLCLVMAAVGGFRNPVETFFPSHMMGFLALFLFAVHTKLEEKRAGLRNSTGIPTGAVQSPHGPRPGLQPRVTVAGAGE